MSEAETLKTETKPKSIWPWLTLWWLGWLSAFGGYSFVCVPLGFGHFKQPTFAGIYWLVQSSVVLFQFWSRLKFEKPGLANLITLALITLGVTATAIAVHIYLPVPADKWAWFEARNIGIIAQTPAYYSGKIPELIFQQLMILLLIRKLQSHNYKGLALLGMFALGFGGVHIPIIIVQGWVGTLFIIAATAASLVFVPPVLYLRNGITYSFSIHLSAYTLCGVLLRYFSQSS